MASLSDITGAGTAGGIGGGTGDDGEEGTETRQSDKNTVVTSAVNQPRRGFCSIVGRLLYRS
jgi:hypothetical protein